MLIVKAHKSTRINPYFLNRVTFSLVSSPEDGRRQCLPLLVCRDYLHEAVRAFVQQDDELSHKYNCEVDPPMDMKKLRLLVVKDHNDPEAAKDFKKKLFNAKTVINFYEDVAGWKKSKIARASLDFSDSEEDVVGSAPSAYLLTGPGKWMNYPNLLSMVTLILRVLSTYGPVEFKGHDSLIREYERILSDNLGSRADEITMKNYRSLMDMPRDLIYLKLCHKKFYLIAKNVKRLFTENPMETYPYRDHAEAVDFHYCGGIVALCTHIAANEKLNKKFKDLCAAKTEEEEKREWKKFYDRYGS